jgi:uncharacterized protein YlxP (DUF503 family)
MEILVMTIRLRAPWCRSLKDKRAQIKRLIMGLRHQFNASVCESGCQEALTMMEIQAAMLVFHHAQADSMAQQLMDWLERNTEAEMVDVQREIR